MEAWRQRLIGMCKLKLLEQMPRAASRLLVALAGGRQAAAWHKQCAGGGVELRSTAEAQKDGRLLRGAAVKFKGGREMREAFQRGWQEAQEELPEHLMDVQAVDVPTDLNASLMDLKGATEVMASAGVAVFLKDEVPRSVLRESFMEFQERYAWVQKALKQHLWMPLAPLSPLFGAMTRPSHVCALKILEVKLRRGVREPYRFNEVCSRGHQRLDVLLESKVKGPWEPLVDAVLGDHQELYRGVLLSRRGAGRQEWHRDSERLFDVELPPHALTIFLPLQEITKEMGPTSFRPGSHLLKAWPREAQAPQVPLGALARMGL